MFWSGRPDLNRGPPAPKARAETLGSWFVYIVRGVQTMWRGDAAEVGSPFREFVITSNEFNSTLGTLQVFGLDGVSSGIKDGKFAPSDAEPTVLSIRILAASILQ